MNRPEQALQQSVTQGLDALLKPPALWFPIPNGGARSKAEAAIMKGHGLVKAGVADLCIIWPNAMGVDVGFIELKADASESAGQAAFGTQAIAAGCGYAVCRSVEEVTGALAMWGCPLKGRVSA